MISIPFLVWLVLVDVFSGVIGGVLGSWAYQKWIRDLVQAGVYNEG